MSENYLAYLLRLQRSQAATHWRVTLENAHTGEVYHFANEMEMLRYLFHTLADATPSDNSDNHIEINSSM